MVGKKQTVYRKKNYMNIILQILITNNEHNMLYFAAIDVLVFLKESARVFATWEEAGVVTCFNCRKTREFYKTDEVVLVFNCPKKIQFELHAAFIQVMILFNYTCVSNQS